MFFYLSKIIWFFIQPSSVLMFATLVGVVLITRVRSRQSKWWRFGKNLALFSISALIILGFSPIGNILIMPLEERIGRVKLQNNTRIDGIVVLGGSIVSVVSQRRPFTATNQASERLIEGAKLARRWPNAKIVFSGGSMNLTRRKTSEATLAKEMLIELGIDGDRIYTDHRSSNTFENAEESKKLMKPKPGENWLLVTSAFHMPRSMGCFRQVGFSVMPWPVDYRTRGGKDAVRFFSVPSAGLRRIDIVTREWIGLIAYRLTGRIPSFFPEADRP